MEEQLEMEEAAKLRGGPAEGGNRKETRRLTLQLGSMIAQWMVLLACVIGIGLCYLKLETEDKGAVRPTSSESKEASGPDPEPQWICIKLNLSGGSMKPIDIKKEDGTMNILNQTIQVRCDGHYLFFLKGTVHLKQSRDSLMLRVKNSQKQQNKYLLEVLCSVQPTVIQKALVSQLRAQDEISLEANQSAISQDLSLFLIMLTPHSYCSPGKS